MDPHAHPANPLLPNKAPVPGTTSAPAPGAQPAPAGPACPLPARPLAGDPWDHLRWQEQGRQTLHQSRLFTFYTSRQQSSDGRVGDFTLLECPDWVNVVALDRRGPVPQVLLVRQYRFGGGLVSLEFPGGVVDPGESPAAAARRELLEECGCTAGTWFHLGSINPNPAFMTNQAHSWLALDLDIRQDRTDLDELEILAAEAHPLADLLEGRLPDFERNGVMMCTWYWFRQWLSANPGALDQRE